ncbi:4446_t:CDS:2 [Funneliformis geosporum]|nr:4446_t:CDS:2 [Funneliformis geosporum]
MAFKRIGDLGLSKSATEADDNEIYGIIPYMAPEVLQGQKYTKKSDIYSFGMIMWECMTGRRPFWDRAHDTELIIDICDGLHPPIGNINAPEGYIELMKKCWDPDQSKRPASGISSRIWNIGNILVDDNNNGKYSKIGDLELSKSATKADVNETYGIIPYMIPEVL